MPSMRFSHMKRAKAKQEADIKLESLNKPVNRYETLYNNEVKKNKVLIAKIKLLEKTSEEAIF